MRNVTVKSCRENQNTHFMFFKNRAVWNIMRENITELRIPQTTIRRMRIACWMTKATDTRSEYLTLTAFPRQQRLRERTSVLP
jgi:hypothetical protein